MNIMKSLKYYLMAVAGMALLNSCDDDNVLPGDPVIDLKTEVTSALFGDSLAFTINASDIDVPLSTLKAQLFFGEEKVSETVIRTKVSGDDYTGKIYVPFYQNIPNGTATLKFILQNIHFTITEIEQDLALTRPDFPYLTFVTDEAEYRMDKVAENKYAVTDVFEQRVKGYIKSPKMGENGNEIFFGWDGENIVQGTDSQITFSNYQAGNYTISFNTLSYEGSPFVMMKVNDKEMTMIGDDLYSVKLNLVQNQSIAVEVIPALDQWWLDPDYFEVQADGSVKFLPVAGDYKIIANTASKVFSCTRLNGNEDATLGSNGSGAIWLMGWGVGSPSMDKQFGWTPGEAYCVAEIAPKIYQFTGKAGPEHGSSIGHRFRTDYLSFKFFHQNGWGGEFANDNALTIIEGADLIKDAGNFELADGAQLELDATYVITIDLTNGNSQGTISFKKK